MSAWLTAIIAGYAAGVIASWRFAASHCLEDIEDSKTSYDRHYRVTADDKTRAVWKGLLWAMFWPLLLVAFTLWSAADWFGSTLHTERERQQRLEDAERDLRGLAAELDLPLLDPGKISLPTRDMKARPDVATLIGSDVVNCPCGGYDSPHQRLHKVSCVHSTEPENDRA